ncbi:carboxylesterase [Hysterangium stoloniferum]|nr:carboxylesterase [Hysterangium stoloniferum]
MKPYLCLLSGFISVALAQSGLTVNTQQGLVTGSLAFPSVRQFLGIPYATANRWQPPQFPAARSVTFNATTFGHSCVQTLSQANLEFLKLIGLGDQSVDESEDCLSVNIWTPSTGRKQGTAVMLWIHGGGFQFGTSNTDFYQGQNLVRDNDDVLLVTMNYRTNIFGAPNAPQLVDPNISQNFGMLDVDLAIQWVHNNIGEFGGDPNRIVLFGQSAGSAIIDAYTYTHPTDQIIKGVIEQSGSIAGQIGLLPQAQTLDPTAWNTVSGTVGCGNATTPEQLACMKTIPFRALENGIVSTGTGFGPVFDGITIPLNASALSSAGRFLNVPMLIGNTAQEGDIFIVAGQLSSSNFTVPVVTQVAADAVTSLAFECPAVTTSNDRVTAGVPTWRYQYQAIFPDISSRPDLRAFHASEIPIVFGTYNASPFGPPTDAEIVFSKYVQGAWVAFARDPHQGLVNYGWPTYNVLTASVAQLGNIFNQTGVIFGTGALLDVGCLVVDTLVALVEIVVDLLGVIF